MIESSSLTNFLSTRNFLPDQFKDYLSEPYKLSRYKTFKIPKKSGGVRLIEEPLEPLKSIQRTIIGLLRLYELHHSSYGLGGPEKDAIANAKQHCHPVIVKMDVKEFFLNTTANKFRWAIRDIGYLKEIFLEIEKLCFVCGEEGIIRLPTGAPTSPLISSIAFTEIDYLLASLATSHNLTYTRYIDDLTFSGEKYPKGLQKTITNIVKDGGYNINHKKSQVLYRDNNPQIITGVCINKQPSIGKYYKRKLRAELDHLARGNTPMNNYIKGRINYVRQVNPQQADKFEIYFQKRQEFYQNQNNSELLF